MKKFFYFMAAAAVLYITGCKLDPPIYGPPPKIDFSSSYQPLSTGTFWKYEITREGINPDTTTLTVTGETPIINDSLYHTVYGQYSNVGSLLYVYSKDHVFATRQSNYIYKRDIELTFLIDTAGNGETWTRKVTDDGMLEGFPARMVGVMIDSATTHTVYGITYPAIKHTRLLVQENKGGGFETVATYDYYTNKGIGVVENDGVMADGTDLGKIRLFDFSIK